MWQVENRTPFAAQRGWFRDREGAEVWVVAVKATFAIRRDGSVEIAADQLPVLRLAEHHGEPGKSSVKYDADLVLTKKTTDVIVVGHACAPEGKSVTQVDVGFRVGALQKVLRVFGDRAWSSFGMSPPLPFERMPLVYERAYGGIDNKSSTPETDWDWRNPVGTGFAVSARNAAGLRLPNIEDPAYLIRAWDDRPVPAGFGVIASHWQPRARYAGTYDEDWQNTRAPLLATDLDDRWFQCAPVDQHTAELLRGGEPVVLHNLSSRGIVEFALPKTYLGFETRFVDGSRQVHTQRALHTVILEPDFPRVSMVWHSALPCHFKVHKLDRTVITLKTELKARVEEVDDDADLELA